MLASLYWPIDPVKSERFSIGDTYSLPERFSKIRSSKKEGLSEARFQELFNHELVLPEEIILPVQNHGVLVCTDSLF